MCLTSGRPLLRPLKSILRKRKRRPLTPGRQLVQTLKTVLRKRAWRWGPVQRRRNQCEACASRRPSLHEPLMLRMSPVSSDAMTPRILPQWSLKVPWNTPRRKLTKPIHMHPPHTPKAPYRRPTMRRSNPPTSSHIRSIPIHLLECLHIGCSPLESRAVPCVACARPRPSRRLPRHTSGRREPPARVSC